MQQDHKLLLALGVSSPNPLPTRLADDNDASDPSDRPGGPADPGTGVWRLTSDWKSDAGVKWRNVRNWTTRKPRELCCDAPSLVAHYCPLIDEGKRCLFKVCRFPSCRHLNCCKPIYEPCAQFDIWLTAAGQQPRPDRNVNDQLAQTLSALSCCLLLIWYHPADVLHITQRYHSIQVEHLCKVSAMQISRGILLNLSDVSFAVTRTPNVCFPNANANANAQPLST